MQFGLQFFEGIFFLLVNVVDDIYVLMCVFVGLMVDRFVLIRFWILVCVVVVLVEVVVVVLEVVEDMVFFLWFMVVSLVLCLFCLICMVRCCMVVVDIYSSFSFNRVMVFFYRVWDILCLCIWMWGGLIVFQDICSYSMVMQIYFSSSLDSNFFYNSFSRCCLCFFKLEEVIRVFVVFLVNVVNSLILFVLFFC